MKKFIPAIAAVAIATSSFAASADAHSKDIIVHKPGEERVVTATKLNVRFNPNTESERIAILTKGEKVTINESHENWTQIQLDEGAIGFVDNRYLAPIKEQIPAPAPVDKIVGKAYTTTDLNLRVSGNTQSKVIRVLPENTELGVISRDNGWVKVRVKNETGYVSEEYIADTKQVEPTSKEGTVIATSLYARIKPGKQYHSIGFFNHGQKLTILAEQNDWYQVKVGRSGTGWVSKEYVSVK